MSNSRDLNSIFDRHVAHEFADKDVAATMATMSADAFVNHVATMMGGLGADGEKVSYERIYWDQASLLVQVGLLDKSRLPVAGVAHAHKVLDKDLPANTLLNADQKESPA